MLWQIMKKYVQNYSTNGIAKNLKIQLLSPSGLTIKNVRLPGCV